MSEWLQALTAVLLVAMIGGLALWGAMEARSKMEKHKGGEDEEGV